MTKVNSVDEFFDEELQSIGVKFTDETNPAQMPVVEPKPRAKATEKAKNVPDAEYEAVPQYAPSFMDRLKGCAKWSLIFGGLTMLFFCWQEAGLMDPAAAVPSMCVCTCLGGFKIGGICRGSQYGNH